MRYEIINPSDKCYISSENPAVACWAGLLLGSGTYALRDENNETVLPFLFFADHEKWFQEQWSIGIRNFMEFNLEELADCFGSFEYAGSRTSMNDIGGLAKETEAGLRRLIVMKAEGK